jgi:Sigma-70 region 2
LGERHEDNKTAGRPGAREEIVPAVAGGAGRRRGARARDHGRSGERGGARRRERWHARLPRDDIERAAADLVRCRGGEILGTARRYAYNLDDAEDAYQRGLEILLTKAPTTREEELVPWLKTVVLRTIRPSVR